MKKLYLHIGTGKTGSTSIQNTLNNVCLGDVYFSYRKKASKFINNIDSIIDHLKTRDEQVIIYSIEWLFIAQKNFLKELAEKLKGSFDVYIVMYIRRQDEFLISSYQQNTKKRTGKPASGSISLPTNYNKNRIDYLTICRKWSDIFSKEKMIVRVFSKEALLEGCVVKDFARVVGIPIKESEIIRSNESIGKVAFKLAHIVKKYDVNPDIYRKIIFDAPSSYKALPSRADAEAFYRDYIVSNKKLKQEFSIQSDYDTLFSDDFSIYPEIRTDQWDEESAELALLHLCEVLLKNQQKNHPPTAKPNRNIWQRLRSIMR